MGPESCVSQVSCGIRVRVRVVFRAEICKLYMRDFETAHHILERTVIASDPGDLNAVAK